MRPAGGATGGFRDLSRHPTLLDTLTQSQDADDFTANWHRLSQHFDTIFTTEASLAALKRTILQLAVMGKLVRQDPNDEPASALLKRIEDEKRRLISEGRMRKIEAFRHLCEDEATYNSPNGWKWIRFGAVIDLISGQHLKPEEYFDDQQIGSVPYLTGPAEFGVRSPSPTRYTFERRALAAIGDILVTVKGSGVGKTNEVCGGELAISRQLMAVRPILIDGAFTSLVLKTLAARFQEKTVGIAIPGISREDVQEIEICLAPLAEQKRIVAKVDELMALCDALGAHLAESRTVQTQLATALVERAVAA